MVRVSPAVKKQIDKYAMVMGVSSAEFIRRAVQDMFEKMDNSDVVADKVFEMLDNREYIAKLKERLNELE